MPTTALLKNVEQRAHASCPRAFNRLSWVSGACSHLALRTGLLVFLPPIRGTLFAAVFFLSIMSHAAEHRQLASQFAHLAANDQKVCSSIAALWSHSSAASWRLCTRPSRIPRHVGSCSRQRWVRDKKAHWSRRKLSMRAVWEILPSLTEDGSLSSLALRAADLRRRELLFSACLHGACSCLFSFLGQCCDQERVFF